MTYCLRLELQLQAIEVALRCSGGRGITFDQQQGHAKHCGDGQGISKVASAACLEV